jgi:hypothetical protein
MMRRTPGRKRDRYSEGYDRYGMWSEDWRHLDAYWMEMYGDVYPREGQQARPAVEFPKDLTGGPVEVEETKRDRAA